MIASWFTKTIAWFRAINIGIYLKASKWWLDICGRFFPEYARKIRKQRALEAQRKAYAELFESFDFQAVAQTFPFMKTTMPQNGEDAVEYLGELLVEIDRRELAELDLQEKIQEKSNELKEKGWMMFLGSLKDGFEIQKQMACRMVDKDFNILTNAVDWFKKSSKNYEDFPTRVLRENLKTELLDSIYAEAVRKTEQYVQSEWSGFVEGKWAIDFPGTVQLPPLLVAWENPTGKALGGAVGLATAGSVTLAFGWHTLAWSLANFFPPALLVAGLGAVLMGIAKKDEAAKKLKTAIGNKVDEVLVKVIEGLEQNAKQNYLDSVQSCALALVKSGKAQIWTIAEEKEKEIKAYKVKIDVAFKKARVQYTAAEAMRQMDLGVRKTRDAFGRGDFVAASTHFGDAFDGLLNWSSKTLEVPLDTWGSKDYQKEFIENLAPVGIGVEIRRKYDDVRLFRNKAIHERERLLLRSPEQYKKDLKSRLSDMEQVIAAIKEKTNGRA